MSDGLHDAYTGNWGFEEMVEPQHEEWHCLSDSYDEKTGRCMADGEQCRGFNCPYEQYESL